MSIGIELAGAVVLVTGGTKGVGRGIAARFAEAGARIAVCARREPEELPEGWTFFPVDLRDADAAWAMIDAVVERFGQLDVLVNNAGGAPPADTATVATKFTDKIVALNLLSAIYCMQRANHWMQQQDSGGSIVNIGSICAHRASPTAAAYGAAKAGLWNYTQTAAMDWAPKVRVNHITAGLIRTEQAHLYYGDEEGIAAVGATVPILRLANPSEIGDACLYLASSLASYVTGADLSVHGGGERPPFLGAANA